METPYSRRARGVSDGSDRLLESPNLAGRSTSWFRTAFAPLAVVLAVIGGAYWAVRRWLPRTRSVRGGALAVAERVSLSPKHSVALMRLGRRYVLLGVSPDRVSLLTEISDSQEVADLQIPREAGASHRAHAFDDLLLRESAGYGGGGADEAGERPVLVQKGKSAAEPLVDLLNRLRGLRAKP